MTSTAINLNTQLSLAQAAQLILATPSVRYCLEGEPGIGKSSIMRVLKEAHPDYHASYMDVPTMDLGDISMPMVDKELGITRYAPNSRFGIHLGGPIICMLDEYAKGATPVKNMLHSMFETDKPRLGDLDIHPLSHIFATCNLSDNGLGDSLAAHTRNRLVMIHVRKPTALEWLDWGFDNGLDGSLALWVKDNPHAFASYTDGDQTGNHHIFNPRITQKAFFSPRSAMRANEIISKREAYDAHTLIAALSGAVGEATARDMEAHIAYKDELPRWADMVRDPKRVPVPKSSGACAVMAYGAIQLITKDTMTPFMDYLERFDPEWQAVFGINVVKNKKQAPIAYGNRAFANWVQKNEDLL